MTDPRVNKIQTTVDVSYAELIKLLFGVNFREAEKRYLAAVANAIDTHAEVAMYEGMTNHDDLAQLPPISDPVPRQPTKEEEAAAITRKRQEDCTRHPAAFIKAPGCPEQCAFCGMSKTDFDDYQLSLAPHPWSPGSNQAIKGLYP